MAASRSEYGGAAGARLAAIPELMEMILLELPLRDVLAAQRVNKDFRGTIRDSHKLQKALFFAPIDKTVGDWLKREQQNPVTSWVRQAPEPDETPRTTTLNPFVYRVDPSWLEFIGRRPTVNGTVDYYRIIRDDLTLSAHSYLTAQSPASLKRMQIFQPPACEVWLHCPAVFEAKNEAGKCYEPHWHSIQARQGQPGVTVGDIKEHADLFGGTVELVIPSGTKLLCRQGYGRWYVGSGELEHETQLVANCSRTVYEFLERNTEHVAVPSSPPLVTYCMRRPISRFDLQVVGHSQD
ncbi:hypothetical protein CBER1_08269 [Cercospora berteroae]|uniref:F-box domain-containing protein n=1 Tax=Cercospora berteroae TaxID=357750 RepID=A0A2S6CET6_9PEZI|nr:hypothetical protein CBER1_08269 [Cercospora berteroae]